MGQLKTSDLQIIYKALDMLYNMRVVNYGDYLEGFFSDEFTLGQIRDAFEKVKERIGKIICEVREESN